MRTSSGAWSLAGLVSGLAGLATSYLLANALAIRESPVVAIAELVIRLTPGPVAEWAIQVLGYRDKLVLVLVMFALTAVILAWIGRLARKGWWQPLVGYVALAAVAVVALVVPRQTTGIDLLPVLIGFLTWCLCLWLLTERLRRIDASAARARADEEPAGDHSGAELLSSRPVTVEDRDEGGARQDQSRRGFIIGVAGVAGVAAVLGAAGRIIGSGRRRVEEVRRLLRLAGVSAPRVPAATRIDVPDVTPWMTPADEFYLIDTALIKPTIEPSDWSLRIHGMVEREINLSFDDLAARELTQAWITLNCVSNEVGGNLIGNAWWSGVRVADLLAMAGPLPDADAVLQTSDDGWDCGTPLEALTDDRNAMLAIAMNGKPLPINHGFPVRTVVPGLYGYVSACKWVVDMEVTKFSEVEAYWTTKGWGEKGPVKMSSRIDVPNSGDTVPAGRVVVAGVAWAQHRGISGVEVAVDGGAWQEATLAGVPNDDCWVQWKAEVSVTEGDHEVKVRATDKDGVTQTGALADVLPDGATGWHSVEFSAEAE